MLFRRVYLPFPLQGPQPIIDAVTAKITDCTKLVVLDHITSPTATILPVVEIAAAIGGTAGSPEYRPIVTSSS